MSSPLENALSTGSPRAWLDRPLPITVRFDNGIRMFHEDAFHMGAESTLLPLFRTVDALHSGDSTAPTEDIIDWPDVDFVTDRNNLRKLLRWVREPYPGLTQEAQSPAPMSPTSTEGELSPTSEPAAAGSVDSTETWDPRKDFRIDLQLGGPKTVLMHRWAARAREYVAPPKGGCRANFERESTAPASGCEDAEGHYRIVRYVSVLLSGIRRHCTGG